LYTGVEHLTEARMFLGVLTTEQKRAFVALAEQMITADAISVGSEADALATLYREMGVERSSEQAAVEQLVGAFDSRQARVAALLELIGLGYSDANYCVDEKSFVATVAREMNLTSELPRLEEWVKTHVDHIEAALAMMHE
jgi:hypothetical protein